MIDSASLRLPWSTVVAHCLLAGVLTAPVIGADRQAPPPQAAISQDAQTVVVAVGAAGEPKFGQLFSLWADRWSESATRAGAKFVRIGGDSGETLDRDRLRDVLAAEQDSSREPLWLVLIGHGTFDGRTAKFNLRHADVAAAELAEWLKPHHRPLVIVNCASSSGPFINALSAPGRVVITATKSGQEHNFACFGDYFSQAIAAPQADLDRDGQTSVLEAFLAAARGVAEFYGQEARLATEHSLLDDTGDTLGTPADWFQGVRATKRPPAAQQVDGRRARQLALVRSDVERDLSTDQRELRDRLELDLERVRDRKSQLDEDDYYRQVEQILRQLAALYQPTTRN